MANKTKQIFIKVLHLLLQSWAWFEDSFYNQDGEQILKDEKSTSLDTPISLGASLNFKISKVTTIFVSYNDFVALGVSDNGETPLDFNLGLRFNL